jgi:replicative DNA helicase
MEQYLEQHFTEIIAKVKKMKIRMERLELENENLKKSVFNYLQLLEKQRNETNQLAQQARYKQIAEKMNTSQHSLAKELDQYILMIDQCIAAVNTKF